MKIKQIEKIIMAICCAALLLPSFVAQAGVQVIGTRLIFNGAKKEASLPVENSSTRPFLVQAWVDDGNDTGGPSTDNKTPFFVTPPLSRLDGGKQNILRVLRAGGGKLPTDRESVFWMNVKEIPEAAKEQNVLQIAMRSRIKLFYRPEGLQVDPLEAHTKLNWTLLKQEVEGKETFAVRASNPTPYFLTVSDLKINGSEEVPTIEMVAPFSQTIFSLGKTKYAMGGAQELSYRTINDYGAETEALKVNLISKH